MKEVFMFPYDKEEKTGQVWNTWDRGSFVCKEDFAEIAEGWISTADANFENLSFEFEACAPEDAAQVQIWAGFRHYSRDYRYVVALRGGGNNHLYLARLGAEGYDKMLALRPLEFLPMLGVWYRLRVVCAGSRIAVYLGDDGQPLICTEDEDAPFCSGGISLGGSSERARFRNVRVKEVAADYLAGVEAAPDYLTSLALSKEEKEVLRRRQRSTYRPYRIPALFDGRAELSLNGDWLFVPDYEWTEKENAPYQADYDDNKAHLITVPSSWIPLQAWLEGESMRDMNKGMNDNYLVEERIRCMGQTFDYVHTKSACYRHYLDFPKEAADKRIVLDFEGIALISTIYFNGVKVHENIGMFMPMQIDVSEYVRPGRNVLAVEVHRQLADEKEAATAARAIENNYTRAWDILAEDAEKETKRQQDGEIVRRPFCTDDIAHGFYSNHPGGIWRNVRLLISDPVHVKECFFKPRLDGADIEVWYGNHGTQEKSVELSCRIVHRTTGELLWEGSVEEFTLPAGKERHAEFSTPQVSPQLWGPKTPNLYVLSFELRDKQSGALLDCYKEQVGFRTVCFEGSTLMYNGRPLWVRGGNHMPAHIRPNDAKLAKKFMETALGHNVIATRTHVAPWTSVWLDAADEAGLMVSYEGTWSWLMLEHIPSKESLYLWKKELLELIRRNRNRPSLFLMTMNNEMKFYLHGDPDEVIIEKGRILDGAVKLVREAVPHLPLVCDSAYFRKHAMRSGRYENIIKKYGYDDGDMDDPHGYYGWYNPDFFHFMNGEFGRDYAVPGRPCMSQECATGYPRAEDGLPTRAYLFMHQTPQTTVGKKAYEYCSPEHFLKRHAMLTKELAEMFRRVEHERTCGVLLFAFETWFYHQHDAGRLLPMLSAKKLASAYQPVLASAQLWGRHFFAGDMLRTSVTLIHDDRERDVLKAAAAEVKLTAEGRVLASAELAFGDIPYFRTSEKALEFRLPEQLPKARTEAVLSLRVVSRGRILSENEYELLVCSREWGMGTKEQAQGAYYYVSGDETAKALFEKYDIEARACSLSGGIGQGTLLLTDVGECSEDEVRCIRKFAEGGGRVLIFKAAELPEGLLGAQKAEYQAHRQEIVTMNMPEHPVFDGIGTEDIAWFTDGQNVPYAASGRYSVDRMSEEVHVLAETLEWHGYIDRPTDYRKFGGTPLFSVAAGKGSILVSTLRADACDFDPVAARLTANLIKHGGK